MSHTAKKENNNALSKTKKPFQKDSLLLVLPVPQYQKNGKTFFEIQACHGLEMWSNHFSSIIIASPQLPTEQVENNKTIVWVPINSIRSIDRIRFIPLPLAHSPSAFIKTISSVRKKLRPHIKEEKFLHFAIGGLFGDWGSIASYDAYNLGKPYSVHMDWISHNVMKQSLDDHNSLFRKCKRNIHSYLARWWNNRAISRAYVALCNGKTCYDYYRTINKNSFKIYDIHVGKESLADTILIEQKKERAKKSPILQLCYAGRMDPMKSPLDWLRAIAHARDLGAKFQATWYGEGPLKKEFNQEIKHLELQEIVRTPGYIPDRCSLLEAIGQADIFLMTHITDESPRCIIESLIKGTPVFGYRSSYALDVLGANCPGELCPIREWKTLGKKLALISKDRARLSRMIELAAKRGKGFTDEKIFNERSRIIKEEIR